MPDFEPAYDVGDLEHFLRDAIESTTKAVLCACDARVPLRAHQALERAREQLLEAERFAPPPRTRERLVEPPPF